MRFALLFITAGLLHADEITKVVDIKYADITRISSLIPVSNSVTMRIDPSGKFVVFRGEKLLVESMEEVLKRIDVAPVNVELVFELLAGSKLSAKTADIPQALAILGLRAATNLITALLLRQAFPASSGALMQRFWDDSTRIAETAGTVARHVRSVSREEALTYGLFRNCGIAVMIAKFPDYGSIVDAHSSSPGPDLAIAEEAKYRFNHARVGYALARGWNLPDALCRSIQHHHDFARVASGTRDTQGASPALIAAGLLAEQVAALRAGGSVTPEWETHEAAVLRILAIDADAIVAMVTGED